VDKQEAAEYGWPLGEPSKMAEFNVPTECKLFFFHFQKFGHEVHLGFNRNVLVLECFTCFI
jgi:hypothetical protein